MNKDEINKTLLVKYGALDLSRYYIGEIRNAVNMIKIGIESNNFALASKEVGALDDAVAMLGKLFNMEDARKQIKHLDNTKK